METQNLYAPFEVEYCELAESTALGHKHNFFELVYIIDGIGVQCINKNKLPYSAERLFLLMPQDCHSFEVTSLTKLFFIRFNDIYLKTQSKEWLQKLEFIFQTNHHLPGCILKHRADKPLVKSLVEALMREQINQPDYYREVAQQIINTLITIVARNLSILYKNKPSESKGHSSQNMISYVQQNIYSPEHLRAEKMADHFHVSPTYISEYFKKQTGQSLQQYITSYKLKLVETRLQYSDLRMNEIANELNFTDESHLSRIFKKYKGISPSEFRKQSAKSHARS